MSVTLFRNARIFDGFQENCPEDMHVLVERGVIKEISDKPLQAKEAFVIDVAGRTLMPGLIDAHIHSYFSDVSWHKTDAAGPTYRTAHAARMLGFALDCGFTTVRDIGGGDYELWRAIDERLIRAPRFFYAGKMISMTGGHGDSRSIAEIHHQGYCSCGEVSAFSVIADGVDACIKAAREELRRGAHCIKIMGSGGIASPTDPVWMNQFREDEIRAIVNETSERRTYTSAHCHPADAVRRCVEFGVRVIEHATLIDAETASFISGHDVYVVPTLVIIHALATQGRDLGLSASSESKAKIVNAEATNGLELMRRAGVRLGFGTDLLGETYTQQCDEFRLRREVFTPIEILRQATATNAAVLMQDGKLGCVKTGAFADLLVVDGDPLSDIELLTARGGNLPLIMRAGEIVKNELALS